MKIKQMFFTSSLKIYKSQSKRAHSGLTQARKITILEIAANKLRLDIYCLRYKSQFTFQFLIYYIIFACKKVTKEHYNNNPRDKTKVKTLKHSNKKKKLKCNKNKLKLNTTPEFGEKHHLPIAETRRETRNE